MGVAVFNGKELPRLKLSFLGERFFINEKKRTVTCKMRVNLQAPSLEVYRALNLKHAFPAPFDVVATVRLREGDKWDETVGRQLAHAKAKRNAYINTVNRINRECVVPILEASAVIAEACEEMKTWAQQELEGMDRLSPGYEY